MTWRWKVDVGAVRGTGTPVLATFVPHVVDSLVGALLTEDPEVMAETRGRLGDVLTRRDADASALDALDGALSRRLRHYPEALHLLRA